MVTVRFRDPKYPDDFIFKAQRLPGAIDPPTVLAPENRSNDYRPQIGKKKNFLLLFRFFNAKVKNFLFTQALTVIFHKLRLEQLVIEW